jgi:hypothetical protein
MGQLVQSIAAGRKASALFKALSRVEVTFNPFDTQATTARYVGECCDSGPVAATSEDPRHGFRRVGRLTHTPVVSLPLVVIVSEHSFAE